MDLGFIHTAQSGAGPLAGYTVPFLANASLAKIVSGVIGAIVVIALIWIAGRSLQKRSDTQDRQSQIANHQP
jgi:CRISPR/Cas system endoribonuclease Cas6 (RAMP superfamily)